ncbi:energy transducer TonB [Undibacterium sp. Tian12W]|uniref:energy transducer TonB n=1 Tax=Undibacterium sp. Tian12W TaxID=3413054 RepID=UPI003BF316C9
MEFTQNQQHPFKRMSRLGVVAVLHVALLAALLNSMKIKVSPPVFFEPKSIHEPEKPKSVEPDYFPPTRDTLPPPINPPVLPPTDVIGDPPPITPPVDRGGKTDEGNTGKVIEGTGVSGSGTGTGTQVVKNPVHVAAVVDMSRCEKPAYPARSIRIGETGTVTLAMLIGTDGRVLETKTEGSSGSRDLDKAASQALSLCRFTPGTIDGVAQQSWTKVQYVWKID